MYKCENKILTNHYNDAYYTFFSFFFCKIPQARIIKPVKLSVHMNESKYIICTMIN